MKIRIFKFKGLITRLSEQFLPTDYAQRAVNCNLKYGNLNPIKGLKNIKQLEEDYVWSFLKYANKWLVFDSHVSVAYSPVQGNTYNRIYLTIDGVLKGTDEYLIQSDTYYTIGLPAPTFAPSVAVSGSGSGDTESRTYVYTYVRTWPDGKTDESKPSPASDVVDVANGQSVIISGFSLPSDYQARGINKIRIYRSNTTSSGEGVWQYVDEINIGVESYTDARDSSALGEELSTENYNEPPSKLYGVINHPNGFLVGYSGNQLCFSGVLQPHAWPSGYRLTFDSQIKGIGLVAGAGIVVATEVSPYLVVGSLPDLMNPEALNVNYPCLWEHGFVAYENAVFYPSSEGLIVITAGSAKNLTENILDKDTWFEYIQDDFWACMHKGIYFGFSPSKSFMFDVKNMNFIELNFYATAAYIDKENNTLYLAVKENGVNYIKQWEGTDIPQKTTWKSGRFNDILLSNISAGRVLVEPPSFKLEHPTDIKTIVDSKQNEYLNNLSNATSNMVDLLFDCGEINGAEINRHPINGNCYDDYMLWSIDGWDEKVIFRIYVDGELKKEHKVLSNNAFRLPLGYKGRWLELEIESYKEIHELAVGTSVKELI